LLHEVLLDDNQLYDSGGCRGNGSESVNMRHDIVTAFLFLLGSNLELLRRQALYTFGRLVSER
jgi:hypothetical protein